MYISGAQQRTGDFRLIGKQKRRRRNELEVLGIDRQNGHYSDPVSELERHFPSSAEVWLNGSSDELR
jgi:hypothetical protein